MRALTAAEFGRRMAAVGPFEPAPHLAVAVSGGRDSLALCFLADGWARRRRGSVTALSVDHGLRPGSAAEARSVHDLLGRHGIAHHTLVWRGDKPGTGIEAAGREARYDLLTRWCRRHGIFHLLTGHHREDQAETFLMRLCAGSGPDGLAAMAPVRIRDGVRLLRPLLDVPRARLAGTLRRRGVAWIDDPSNSDLRFARARLRLAAPELAAAGLSAQRLAAAAAGLARLRRSTDWAVASVLARSSHLSPFGFATVDRAWFAGVEPELARRALGRLIGAVGGGVHPPRTARIERLVSMLRADPGFRGATLGGCRLYDHRGRLHICRERRGIGARLEVQPGWRGRWDGRFSVEVSRGAGSSHPGLTVAFAGETGQKAAKERASAAAAALPASVIRSLPALWDVDGLVSIPHLRYERERPDTPSGFSMTARFRPALSLTPALAGAN